MGHLPRGSGQGRSGGERSAKRLLNRALTNALLLLLGGIIGALIGPPVVQAIYGERGIAKVEPDANNGTAITAYNRRGEPLWVKDFASPVNCVLYRDLDGDGRVEIVVGLGFSGERAGEVVVLRANGKEQWEHPTSSGETANLGPFTVVSILPVDLDANGKVELVVCSHHYREQPARLDVLSHMGERLGTFLHRGYIYALTAVDVDEDGILELLCGATNESCGKAPVLFSLDTPACDGQLLGCGCDSDHAPAVLTYAILPKSTLPEYSFSSEVTEFSREGSSIVVSVSDGRFYRFSLPKLEPMGWSLSSGFWSRMLDLSPEMRDEEVRSLGHVQVLACRRS